jgi:iron complex outermembrane receptor protein
VSSNASHHRKLFPQTLTVAAAVAFAITGAQFARAADNDTAGDADTSATSTLSEVVVTGTRAGGISAAESPAPVQLISQESLQAASGNPDLMATLAQVVPSVTLQAFGADMAGQTMQAKMRGLSPNHVLILINGKRRHTTANIAVDIGSTYTGGANVDLNFIPVDAIDHIEVLTDGAAAQYGTDAIAGVINIILKHDTTGGSVTAMDGKFFDNQGPTSDVSGHAGFAPYDGMFFDVTGEFHNQGHTYHGGIDPNGVAASRLATYPNSNVTQLNDYPYENKIEGNAEIHTKIAMVNAGADLFGGAAQFYLTGSYGHKEANSYENYRRPQRVSFTDPATGVTDYPFPLGFNPREATQENDFQVTSGFKGTTSDWNWDLGYSYGKDRVQQFTLDSIGNSFALDGLPTASDFYDGFLQSSQAAITLDINRDFDVGLAGPLNVAFGGEYRLEGYTIGAGIPESYLSGGAQSFPGIPATAAGSNSRKNEAFYVDLAAKPLEQLRIDLAGRYEHYSDFGSTEVGKFTARYDLTSQYAVRATVSNGFRAPTLAEEHYNSTNVGPSTAFVQLPPNSAAGRLLGLGTGLQPEKSINYSLGFVLRPIQNMTVTLDAYQIGITNRIVNTGDIIGSNGGALTAAGPALNAAIAANGTQIDPFVAANGLVGIQVFANGIDTRTRGLDLVFDYPVTYSFGKIDYGIAGTWSYTVATKIPESPAAFGGAALYDTQAISDLTTANPRSVFNFSAAWSNDVWNVSLVEKIYGPATEYGNDDADNPTGGYEYFPTRVGTTPTTNLDIALKASSYLKFSIGAINLFNRFPGTVNPTQTQHEFAAVDNAATRNKAEFAPFGINGGFYYAKATVSW